MNLPQHIKEALTQEECSLLFDKINTLKLTMPVDPVFQEDLAPATAEEMSGAKKYGKILNKNMGKIYFNLDKDFIPKSIQDKINAIAEELEPGVKFHGGTYTEYSAKYGTPSLATHTDRFDIFLLLDLQLHSNTSWGLSANGIEYDMKDGDILALHAGSTEHGRPEKIFKDEDIVCMIFLDFFRPGMDMPLA